MILASRRHSMSRRPSCLILLRLSRFFAIYTTDTQVFEFECTEDKSRVVVKQQVEIKTAETRTFCTFKVWLQRENSYEFVISLRTMMSWPRACWFARSFLEQLEQSNKVVIALHFEETACKERASRGYAVPAEQKFVLLTRGEKSSRCCAWTVVLEARNRQRCNRWNVWSYAIYR